PSPDPRLPHVPDQARPCAQHPKARIGRTRADRAADRDDDLNRWSEHSATLERHEPFRNFVYPRKIGDGPERMVSISGNPLFDASGRFIGYRGTARDVTDQILAERGLH